MISRAAGRVVGTDRRELGFSLAEVLVAMMLFGVLGALVLTGAITVLRDLRIVNTDRAGGDAVQASTERLSRELRQSGAILTEGTSNVTFWLDSNADFRRTNDETVTWASSIGPGGLPQLCRQTAASVAAAECVTLPAGGAVSFAFDSSTPASVRVVTVRLSYQSATGVTRNQQWEVSLRNVG